MNRLKKLKYVTLVMLLFGFIAASSLTSCREQKKKESTEQAGEHPEGEEHPHAGRVPRLCAQVGHVNSPACPAPPSHHAPSM